MLPSLPERLRHLQVKDVIAVMKSMYPNFEKDCFISRCEQFQIPLDKKIKEFSTGMKAKLKVLLALSHDAKFLIMDEPTPHLDMESITALNNGLIKFNGVVLFTSQDHQFIQTIANRIMEITPGGLIDKISTYDEYLDSDEMARKRQILSVSAEEDD